MNFAEEFKHKLFQINDKNFLDSSLAAFEYQYNFCKPYNAFCNYLKKSPKTVKSLSGIPFMPIEFFKNHAIKSGEWKESKIFKSSGTTATGRSMHFVKDIEFYHKLSKKIFEDEFGEISDYKIVAILPSYQEQGDSSLISMVDYFMKYSHPESGYYLNEDLEHVLTDDDQKLVIGVSYALLNCVEHKINTKRSTIMETGGMKGRKKEITREQLHASLKIGFNTNSIYSEYGMTELFSQAYGKNGVFGFPSWTKCMIRDINDPFSYLPQGKTGGINIIDLANIDSCCFIETKDLGRATGNTFEVLGRFDNSDIRGCNLMI